MGSSKKNVSGVIWSTVVNIIKVLVKCFLPYLIIGVALYVELQQITMYVPVFMMFVIKGVMFLVFFGVITYFLLNKADKAFISKIIKRK